MKYRIFKHPKYFCFSVQECLFAVCVFPYNPFIKKNYESNFGFSTLEQCKEYLEMLITASNNLPNFKTTNLW